MKEQIILNPYTYSLPMNIPTALKGIIDTLPPHESEELTQLLIRLSSGDQEIQELLQNNLDILTQILVAEDEV